jgi:hypothetical protein
MHYMNWKRDIAVYDEMGNRLKKRRKPKNGA